MKRYRFYLQLRQNGLKETLKHSFNLHMLGYNKAGHLIISYVCPVCGRTLVADIDAEESLTHSDEFCKKRGVNEN